MLKLLEVVGVVMLVLVGSALWTRELLYCELGDNTEISIPVESLEGGQAVSQQLQYWVKVRGRYW